MDTYKVLHGKLSLIDKPNLPKPSEDPFWLINNLPKLNNYKTACDIGCGIGIIGLMLSLQNKNLDVTGYDIDNLLIDIANKNAKLNNLNNCNFIQKDIFKKPPTNKFDIVVSNPPYHKIEAGFNSKDNQKKLAHGQSAEQMQKWLEISINSTNKSGICYLIHHTKNINLFYNILSNVKHSIIPIITSNKRPPKRAIIAINI